MPNKISPESSDGLFRSPLELFSLEREGRPVAGRPFRHSGRFATNRARAFSVVSVVLLLMQAARRHAGLAASITGQILSLRCASRGSLSSSASAKGSVMLPMNLRADL